MRLVHRFLLPGVRFVCGSLNQMKSLDFLAESVCGWSIGFFYQEYVLFGGFFSSLSKTANTIGSGRSKVGR